MEYWSKKEGKKQITVEEWLSKAPPEVQAKPIIHTLKQNNKPVSPGVIDKILGTPIWQISEARIHKSREVQAPQKAINGYKKLWKETT